MGLFILVEYKIVCTNRSEANEENFFDQTQHKIKTSLSCFYEIMYG